MSENSDIAAFLVGAVVTGIVVASVVGSCSAQLTASRVLGTHNVACAHQGGRLVRGQNESFVCIDPKGIKWERK